MAVHKRVRKAGRKLLAHVGRVRRKLQGRRKGAGDDGATQASALNERLSALAAYVLKGEHYECNWELFRFGHLKGMDDEEAIRALGAWANANAIFVRFEVRKVRNVEVVTLLLSAR